MLTGMQWELKIFLRNTAQAKDQKYTDNSMYEVCGSC